MGEECKLLEGFFAWSVQLLLFFMAIGALIVKRQYFEHPQRTLQIWLMDVGKQSGAAGFAHVLNLLTAYLLYKSEKAVSDQCMWYFLNYFVDTTLGIPIAWFYLQVLTTVAGRYDWTRLARTGDYGTPPSYKTWIYQILAWEFVVLLMKSSLAFMLYVFRRPLVFVGNGLAKPIAGNPDLELLIVMIICPCLMNMIQFWIFDSVLKMKVGAVGMEPITLQIASDEFELCLKKNNMPNVLPPIELAPTKTDSRLNKLIKKVKKIKNEESTNGLMSFISPSSKSSKVTQDDEVLEIPKDPSIYVEKDLEEQTTNEVESEDEVDLLLSEDEEEETIKNKNTPTVTSSTKSSTS